VLLPAKFVVLCMKNFSESPPNQLLTLLLAMYFHSIFLGGRRSFVLLLFNFIILFQFNFSFPTNCCKIEKLKKL